MPFVISGYVQSVVVEGIIYVGGGRAGYGSVNDYIVMTYDISTGKWATLPPYRACEMAVTAINYQLVLVGGDELGSRIKVLGMWNADIKQWTHPYPEMRTARSSLASYPGPSTRKLREREGPGIHCLRMRQLREHE